MSAENTTNNPQPSALVALSACQVLAAFERQTLTPSDYLAACLEQISRYNRGINALAAMDPEAALREAEESTLRWQAGCPTGPLDGLPIGVKDLQDTRGLLTTHGSLRGRNNVPQQDLPMVARLRAAGAIILAKTNVPELGAGGNSRNPVWGATGNPFNANLIAGGSSGGSAAALAAMLLPLCTGSDTGGSLRLPAALCGVVGYRPSVDVIAHPTRALGWSGISVLGPMARTMSDLVLMLKSCIGGSVDDPLARVSHADRFDAMPTEALKELRIGYSEDFGGAPVDAAIRDVFNARLQSLRPEVKSCVAVDMNLGEMDRCFDILRAESFVSAFGELALEHPGDFGPNIHENLAIAKKFSLTDRAWAHKEQTRILRQFNKVVQDYDVILMPTSPVSPFAWTQPHATEIDGQAMDVYYRWLALTYRGSLSGGPAITLPVGRDAMAMPFGLQMLGAVGGDEALLAAAIAVEAFYAQSPETARPVPDLINMPASTVDLHSIVTHPPALNATGGQPAGTPVPTATG